MSYDDFGNWVDDVSDYYDPTADDYYTDMSADDWAFELDWNDMMAGNYTMDEISNDVDVQDLYTASQSDPSLWDTITGFAKTVGSSGLKKISSAFKDPATGKTDWLKVAAVVGGGLYGLSQTKTPQPTGYQGGIPKYEAVREKVPNTYDPNRRPGSGGQQYFTDVKYAKEDEAVAARAAAKEEALGLESLNKANPAQQSRPTAAAVAQADESAAIQEGRPASDVIEDRPVPTYAHGGITALAQGGMGKSAPRYLGGATDGMGDKIPARIDNGQEARLSHGEFVIPADIVGHLGNGNSEAGAERLYAMMDRIRKARTGTTKQGKQINPDKFLA